MPASSEGRLLCRCTYRRCCDVPGGVRLAARNHRIHEQDEKEHLRKKALDAQKKVISDQEATIADALSRLSIGQESPAEDLLRQQEAKYRIDKVKEMVQYYGRVLDDIARQKAIINEISQYSKGYHSSKKVYSVLRTCRDARNFISRMEADALRKISRGPLRNEASVEAQRANCLITLQEFEDTLNAVEPFWQRSLEDHKKELAALTALAQSTYDTAYHFSPIMNNSVPIIHLVVFMVVVAHILLGFSRRGSHWLFSMTEYIVQTTAQTTAFLVKSNIISGPIQDMLNIIPGPIQAMLKHFPRDVRTATESLHIEPTGTVYAACPRCDKLYKPTLVDDIPVYRERCNFRRFPNTSRCKALLTYEKKFRSASSKVPIKPFVVFSVKDWISSLTSRAGMEATMDAAWDKMKSSDSDKEGSDEDDSGEEISDIFQASYIRNFKGHDGKHFSQSGEYDKGNADGKTTPDPGRYLFSLGFDFFNPLRNIANGKKVSIGVVALICLNLPIEMRYKPENIFLVGIIPGPKEPSLDALNPYFGPIVDDFLELYKGVLFTETVLGPEGRLILCALIAIIADLPAARKAGGCVSCTHNVFCSLCWCSKTVETYNDFDCNSWTYRTNEECRHYSEQYRAAESPTAAQRLVDKHGLRSSEFLRLPYFDLTINLVVDPMHNLFLGLVKEHFQNIIGCQRGQHSDETEIDHTMNQGDIEDTTAESTQLASQSTTIASNPPLAAATAQNSEPASANRPECSFELQIRPSAGNPLPQNRGGQRAVRKLLSWLESTDSLHLSPDEITALETKWSMSSITINALVYIGKGVGCFPATMTSDGKDTATPQKKYFKIDLAKGLVEWQRKRLEELAKSFSKTPQGPRFFTEPGKILTPNEMVELSEDIASIVKPSWVTSIPTSISSTGPKLKSDQWRVAATLYLPITLIRLWSKPGDDKITQERRELLHLTMLLFSAISIIGSRTTSNNHAQQYMTYMTNYRKELRRIFPKYKCHPNHHMAMHLDTFIRAFGPVHGWWTFPFERMIGMIQRIPVNYKAGQYEETMARTWHRRANLKLLLTKTTCPPIIKGCEQMYTALVRPFERNSMASLAEEHDREVSDETTHINDSWYNHSKEKALSREIIAAFHQRGIRHVTAAIHTNRYRKNTISYSAKHIHEGNSGVLIHIQGIDVPFAIQAILQLPTVHEGSNIWVVARRHRTAKVRTDPYTAYPYLRAKMWSPSLEAKVEVFPFSAIVAQFAKCVIPWVVIDKKPKNTEGETRDAHEQRGRTYRRQRNTRGGDEDSDYEMEDIGGTQGGGRKPWNGRKGKKTKVENKNRDDEEDSREYVECEMNGEVAVCVSLSRVQAIL